MQAQSFGIQIEPKTVNTSAESSVDNTTNVMGINQADKQTTEQLLNLFGSDFVRNNTHLAGKKPAEYVVKAAAESTAASKSTNEESDPIVDVPNPEAFIRSAPLVDVTKKTAEGLEVSWRSQLKDVPEGPTLIIAQEFFDALPVYQFQYTSAGWRERLIDFDDAE